jgi:hypothetical protein
MAAKNWRWDRGLPARAYIRLTLTGAKAFRRARKEAADRISFD